MKKSEINSIIAAMDESYAHNNADRYFSYFADDATIMVPSFGRWTKAEYAEKWKATLARGGGVESTGIKDIHVNTSPAGDAAVATYLMDVTYRALYPNSPPDERQEMTLLMSEVWFKHGDTWKLAHMDWTTREPR